MMETKSIESFTPDAHNFNKGNAAGAKYIDKSFAELGAGRSILVDKDGNIIAGNKSHDAAIKNGIKDVIVVETDGTQLVAVKRTDVSIDSAKGRALAYADNIITMNLLEKLSRGGVDFVVYDDESINVAQLDSQKESGKTLFGKAYMCTEEVAARRQREEVGTIAARTGDNRGLGSSSRLACGGFTR